MFKKLLIAFLCIGSVVTAQENRPKKEAKPVLHEVSNKDVVQSIFPEAAKVVKANEYWFKVSDNDNKTLGYAMSSANYCKTVKGYNNMTPVMIITDKNQVIKKVSLLTNWETLGYVRKLEKKGFFNLWVGKTLKEAKKVHVDGYTGATCTALAVSKNVDFLLNNGIKFFPKKN
jgi:Na+-translocating ferredoxin:NAD+ oxidoreductase RnfG subunit